MKKLINTEILRFQRKIFRFYRNHGQRFPFRGTKDPYKITVAEIMLQQTQMDRVLPKYDAWIKKWPDWRRLAQATNKELLALWSGLGYNRRALYLGQLARTVINDFGGKLPDNPEVLQKLPGIGPYTANAIAIFAFDRQMVALDTNVRRVLLHEFGLPASTSKDDLEALARQVLPKSRVGEWHNALMDYGRLALPRQKRTPKPVAVQQRFRGSRRQIRGEIIRQLTTKFRITISVIARAIRCPTQNVNAAAISLEKEGVVIVKNGIIRLVPDKHSKRTRDRSQSAPTAKARSR